MKFLMVLLLVCGLYALPNTAQAADYDAEVATRVGQIADQVTAWRRDLHQHPELSNREFRTAKVVAQHLRKLGLVVETDVAHTGDSQRGHLHHI